jgi:hypothetical protein
MAAEFAFQIVNRHYRSRVADSANHGMGVPNMPRLLKLVALAAASVFFYAAPAHAQATRTWVSGVGDDANPCSRTAPCKTFAGAILKTAAGGEINCLDPGGFGTVTITKSITIDCTGTFGSSLNSGTGGITVNDSTNTARVIIRGLSINGGVQNLPGTSGIRFVSGRSLTVENVLIQNQNGSPGHGIFFQPGAAAQLFVMDTTIAQSGLSGSGSGIEIAPTAGGSARAVITNVRIVGNNNNGIRLNTGSGPANATIQHSVLSGNVQGIVVAASSNAGNALIVDSDISQNSGTGILAAGAAARVRVAETTIYANGTGVSALSGSSINSFGNNRLAGNATDGAFTPPVIAEQ